MSYSRRQGVNAESFFSFAEGIRPFQPGGENIPLKVALEKADGLSSLDLPQSHSQRAGAWLKRRP
jgi:hypothetical protein